MNRILYIVAGLLTALFFATFTAGYGAASEQMSTTPPAGGTGSLSTLIACALLVAAARFGWRRMFPATA